MAAKEIKIPFSTCRKLLLSDSELRADKDAIKKFEEVVIVFAKTKAKEAQDRCSANKRKTIRKEDM